MEEILKEVKGKQVLVTGGTGFTGTHLVRRLLDLGAIVSAIVRPGSDREHLNHLPITWLEGQVFEESVLREAVRNKDYIFHLATAYREAKWGDEYYRKVHVDSTRLLSECAMEAKPFTLKCFVHVSTVGVLGHIEQPPADEKSPYNPGDVYQDTKAEAEKWIMAFGQSHPDFKYVVIRPAAIFGPGDKRLLKVFKMAQWPLFPVLGFGKTLYHLIHVEDLVNAMLLSAMSPHAHGQIFICGNKEPYSLIQMVQDISKSFGKNVVIVRIPAWPFFIMARINEWVGKCFKVEPWLHTRRVAFYTKDRAFLTSKLQNELKFNYKYDNAGGLHETAKWYKQQGWV